MMNQMYPIIKVTKTNVSNWFNGLILKEACLNIKKAPIENADAIMNIKSLDKRPPEFPMTVFPRNSDFTKVAKWQTARLTPHMIRT